MDREGLTLRSELAERPKIRCLDTILQRPLAITEPAYAIGTMYLTRWRSAPEHSTETLDFKYGLLNSVKTGMRLAQILPGTGNKGVSINLIDSFVSGPQQIPYDALSYTWGDCTRAKAIACNGKRLPVTQTLLEALQRFRDPHKTVTLWIDQLCICTVMSPG